MTDLPLPEGVSYDATLWAACIGGAMQVDAYLAAIESCPAITALFHGSR